MGEVLITNTIVSTVGRVLATNLHSQPQAGSGVLTTNPQVSAGGEV